MIRLDNVEKVYRTSRIETVALSSINLEVSSGDFISVMGPSGCGKSTLLNIIGLLDEPSSGAVQINGATIVKYADRQLAALRNKEIGFVFQTFHLVSDLTVLDNVQIPLLYRPMANAERKRLALEALDRVGLAARVQHFPSQLSGGQQQRVAIARAIVGRPRILLADGGTLGVSPEHIRIAGSGGVSATVDSVEYLGGDSLIACRVGETPVAVRVAGSTGLRAGDITTLQWAGGAQHYFGPDGARREPAGRSSGETMLA